MILLPLRPMRVLLPAILLSLLSLETAPAKTWSVGPTRTYTKPSQVMSLVSAGDTVLIDSGLYVKDVGIWRANRLVLRCPVGYAHLDAQGTAAERKGIWVIDGDRTYVEGIEFSGCAISEADGSNGAGIRFESHILECRRCYFHDNQEGILTGNDTTNEIYIEACEFDHNGVETGAAAGYQHNIYVGHSRLCRIAYCYFHRSIVGHEIKSRANRTYILSNLIVDGADGDGSYSIDLPNGGLGVVVGNIIEKGPRTANSTTISYGEEGFVNPEKRFVFNYNTVVANRQPVIFLHIADGSNALVTNNIFAGGTHLLVGTADTMGNVVRADTAFFHFRDSRTYDYHILEPFAGIQDVTPLQYQNDGVLLWPDREYVHPLDSGGVIPHQPSYIGALAPLYQEQVTIADRGEPLRCYPNPLRQETSIPLPTAIAVKDPILSIYDEAGRRIEPVTYQVFDDRVVVSKGSLSPGSYHFIVTQDGAPLVTGNIIVK